MSDRHQAVAITWRSPTTAELGVWVAKAHKVARTQVIHISGDLHVERRWSAVNASSDEREQLIEPSSLVEELPDKETNLVDAVVRGGVEMQEDAALTVGEWMKRDARIARDQHARLDVGC